MNIILLKDVSKVGRKYDIKNVADGHALNMLIPKGLAITATTQEIKKIEEKKKNLLTEQKIQGELLLKNLEQVKNTEIYFGEKANDKGHLFAGITKEKLVEEIFKTTRLNLDPKSIEMEKPIKEIGEHKIVIEAMGEKVEFKVIVESI